MVNQTSHGRRRLGNPWRIAGWGTAIGLIVLPLIAMQFTREVNWTASDFLFAALMFGSVGLALELAVRTGNRAFTAAAAVALLVSFLSVWITGAVGIIGNESEDFNLLFVGVILIAMAGSAIVLFRPKGMAVVMYAAAAAQAAVPVVASVIGDSAMAAIWSREVVVLTVVFTAMWLVSARLFRAAARRDGLRASAGHP